jgi:hypothetical protein
MPQTMSDGLLSSTRCAYFRNRTARRTLRALNNIGQSGKSLDDPEKNLSSGGTVVISRCQQFIVMSVAKS